MSNYKIETKCIQSGYEPGNGEPRVLPIYQSTTFRYTSSEQMGRLFDLEESGYFYTRLQNPTNDAVAAKICDLEGGVAAMLTSSGQAANFYAIMNIAQEGDHIVCASALYGGTYNLFAHTIKKMGVDATFVDPDCTPEELDAAFRTIPKLYSANQSPIRLWSYWILKICRCSPQTRGSADRGQYICNSDQLPPVRVGC